MGTRKELIAPAEPEAQTGAVWSAQLAVERLGQRNRDASHRGGGAIGHR